MNRRFFLTSGLTLGAVAVISTQSLVAAASNLTGATNNGGRAAKTSFRKVIKTNAQWKRMLTPEQYNVTREKGTEAPYSSPLNEIHDGGTFRCVSCALPLFSSKAKFDSGTGWPSFFQPLAKQYVHETVDNSIAGEPRTEILCARCDAHLGHVFKDGPPPTGLRYCMNGVAMNFVKA